jgi:hypothetical protein
MSVSRPSLARRLLLLMTLSLIAASGRDRLAPDCARAAEDRPGVRVTAASRAGVEAEVVEPCRPEARAVRMTVVRTPGARTLKITVAERSRRLTVRATVKPRPSATLLDGEGNVTRFDWPAKPSGAMRVTVTHNEAMGTMVVPVDQIGRGADVRKVGRNLQLLGLSRVKTVDLAPYISRAFADPGFLLAFRRLGARSPARDGVLGDRDGDGRADALASCPRECVDGRLLIAFPGLADVDGNGVIDSFEPHGPDCDCNGVFAADQPGDGWCAISAVSRGDVCFWAVVVFMGACGFGGEWGCGIGGGVAAGACGAALLG